ncbi:MAG TPA: ribose-phosphate pyrophosphokinase [Porticoccaceae bacterium]|nr:ribose-phosphate pyrophosphokinase [Porticoccaceae bacterium]
MELKVFALNTSREFAEPIARALGTELADHEEREFEDGEHKSRPLENVRGRDVFVIQSLYGESEQSVNDKLVRLLFFLGALRDASAGRLSAVIPYLCYARKDRKSKPRDPVSSRYLATLLEAVGADRVITLDVHNLAAYQNAFRIPADHLEAAGLFVDYFAALAGDDALTVVSPDVGGVKRAEAFRQALEVRLGRAVTMAFVEKYRSSGVVSGGTLVGEVAGRRAIIIDDLISSGSTIIRAARACRDHGAVGVHAAATHGAFAHAADQVLADSLVDSVVITDTIPATQRLSSPVVLEKLTCLSTVALFAQAIERIHNGGSLVDLLEI